MTGLPSIIAHELKVPLGDTHRLYAALQVNGLNPQINIASLKDKLPTSAALHHVDDNLWALVLCANAQPSDSTSALATVNTATRRTVEVRRTFVSAVHPSIQAAILARIESPFLRIANPSDVEWPQLGPALRQLIGYKP